MKSSPMIFSAVCSISVEIRGVGVGDGAGDASGVGLGVCAIEVKGICVAARAAAPNAGSDWTKLRRLLEVIRRSDFLIFFFADSPASVSLPPKWSLCL